MRQIVIVQTGKTFKVYSEGVLIGHVSILTLTKFLRSGVWKLQTRVN